MPTGKRTSEEVRQRIAAVAIGEGRGASETARRLQRGMDGGPPVAVTAEVVRRTVQRIRRDGTADVRPSALAGRMLRLVERELAKLERQTGALDTDRLDKLAATLRRLDPLSQGKPSDPAQTEGLLSLVEPSTEGDGDLGDLSQPAEGRS
jgi:transposase